MIQIAFIIWAFWAGLIHDVPVADYDLFLYDNHGIIEIEIDQQALTKSLAKQGYQNTTADIHQYLNDCIYLQSGLDQIQFDFCGIKSKGHHSKIEGEFALSKIPTKMEVQLTCLVAETFDQTNNIILHYNQKIRGFKLSKAKTKISIKL